jgi:hypothetical protein
MPAFRNREDAVMLRHSTPQRASLPVTRRRYLKFGLAAVAGALPVAQGMACTPAWQSLDVVVLCRPDPALPGTEAACAVIERAAQQEAAARKIRATMVAADIDSPEFYEAAAAAGFDGRRAATLQVGFRRAYRDTAAVSFVGHARRFRGPDERPQQVFERSFPAQLQGSQGEALLAYAVKAFYGSFMGPPLPAGVKDPCG